MLTSRNSVFTAAAVLLLATSGCAILFLSGRYPSTLTGLWLDSITATASDSSFWMLLPNGEERTPRVVAVRAVDGSRRWERSVSFELGTIRMSDRTQRRLIV